MEGIRLMTTESNSKKIVLDDSLLDSLFGQDKQTASAEKKEQTKPSSATRATAKQAEKAPPTPAKSAAPISEKVPAITQTPHKKLAVRSPVIHEETAPEPASKSRSQLPSSSRTRTPASRSVRKSAPPAVSGTRHQQATHSHPVVVASVFEAKTATKERRAKPARPVPAPLVAKPPAKEKKSEQTAAGYHAEGQSCFQKGDFEEALTQFQKAAKLDPQSWTIHFNLGLCSEKLGRLQEAVTEFETATKLDPDQWRAHAALGTCLIHLKKPEPALRALNLAIGTGAEDGRALFCRGLALQMLERFADARETYQALLVDHEDSEELLTNLIAVSAALGEQNEVREYARKLEKLVPDSAFAVQAFARAAGMDDDHDTAAKFYAKLVDLMPNSYETLFNLGFCCRETGRLEMACDAYRQAIQLDGGRPEAHTNLGATLQEMGEFGPAHDAYVAAIKHAPEDPLLLWNMGVLAETQGALEQAEQYYERVLAKEPESEQVTARLSKVRASRSQPVSQPPVAG